ncbi:DMT family transporter [Acinetobacter baumannii]|uniref:EamA domain-containing protein n=1 Tax=Acinetobacter baumannii (strain SDF) TaxID=509170 RepID=B0VLM4_ACIBS|nr:conserved hypothetical protein; putative membrane protein [Acinetobacter baumannii SDF]
MTHTAVANVKLNWTYFCLILASTFLQGSSFVATKILLSSMSPLWVATIRFFIAALSLLPLIIYRYFKNPISLFNIPWLKLFVIGLFQTAGVMAFLNIGLGYTSPSTAAILMASNPLLVVILAMLILGERISIRALVGLIVAFIGVVICIGLGNTNSGGIGRGEVLVILASSCWAIATIINKKFNLHLDPWVITFWQMLLGSLVLFLVALFSQQPFTLPTTESMWLTFLWLAIPASTGAMGLWFAALKIGGAIHTSGFLFLCPLFSAIITYFVLGTVLTSQELIGGFLIGTGIYVLSRYR